MELPTLFPFLKGDFITEPESTVPPILKMSPGSRTKKVGLRRVDAAIDAMLQYGFPRKLIRSTITELLKVYGAGGWVFIEDGSYRILIEALLQKQEESNDNVSPGDEELGGGEGNNTSVPDCPGETPEPEAADMGNVGMSPLSNDTGKDQLRPVKTEVSLVKITTVGEPESGQIVNFHATNITSSATQASLHTNNLLGITSEMKKGGAKNDKLITKTSVEHIPLQIRSCGKEQLAGKECSDKALLTTANTLIKMETKLDNPSPSTGLYKKPVIPTISEKNNIMVNRSTTEETNFSRPNDRKIKREIGSECDSVEGGNVLREVNKAFVCKTGSSAMAAHINTIPSHVNISNPVLLDNHNKVKSEQTNQPSTTFGSDDRNNGEKGDLLNNINVKKDVETARTIIGSPVNTNKVKKEQMGCGDMVFGEYIERRQTGREDDSFVRGVCEETNISNQDNNAHKNGRIGLCFEPTIDGHTRKTWERTKVKEKQEQKGLGVVEFKTEDRMGQRRARWEKIAARMGYRTKRWNGIPANIERDRDPGILEHRSCGGNKFGAYPEASSGKRDVIVGRDGMVSGVEFGRREQERECMEVDLAYQRGDGGRMRCDRGLTHEEDGRNRWNEHDFRNVDNSLRKSNDSFRGRHVEHGRDEMRPRSTAPSQKHVNSDFGRNGVPVIESTVINRVKGDDENWNDKLSGVEAPDLTVNENENSGWGSWGEKYLLKNVKIGRKKEEMSSSGGMAVASYGRSQTGEFVEHIEASDIRMKCVDDSVLKLNEDDDTGKNCQPEKKQLVPDDDDDVRKRRKDVDNFNEKTKRMKGAVGPCRGWIGHNPCRKAEETRPPSRDNGEEEAGKNRRPCHGWIGCEVNNELVQSVPALLDEQLRDLLKGTVNRKLRKRSLAMNE